MKKIFLMILCATLLTSCGVKYDYEEHDTVVNNKVQENTTKEEVEETTTNNAYLIETIVNMKVREKPSTKNTKQIGKIAKNSKVVAYETTKNEDYTWYRIGTNQWVADDGTWLKVNKISDVEINNNNTDFNGTKIRVLENMNTYKNYSDYDSKIGYLGNTSIVQYYEKISVSDVTWYRIGTGQWIACRNGQVEMFVE